MFSYLLCSIRHLSFWLITHFMLTLSMHTSTDNYWIHVFTAPAVCFQVSHLDISFSAYPLVCNNRKVLQRTISFYNQTTGNLLISQSTALLLMSYSPLSIAQLDFIFFMPCWDLLDSGKYRPMYFMILSDVLLLKIELVHTWIKLLYWGRREIMTKNTYDFFDRFRKHVLVYVVYIDS